jgi:hypothetical protein
VSLLSAGLSLGSKHCLLTYSGQFAIWMNIVLLQEGNSTQTLDWIQFNFNMIWLIVLFYLLNIW